MKPHLALSLAVALLALPMPAVASSSAAHETEGGSIRLVTSGLAGADGTIRGALEIALRAGWKTYWRDPGASGVPPRIDISQSINIQAVELAFPAPGWHDDDYGSWAGYDRPVALPVTFTVAKPDRFSLIEADIFLGVCETICIPVKAVLSVDPGSDPDNPDDGALVAAAHAALPAPAGPAFGVTQAAIDGDRLVIAARAPGTAGDTTIFLAASDGRSFGRPPVTPTPDGGFRFEMPLPGSDDGATVPASVDYTLTSGRRSVQGTFQLR